MGNGLEAWGAWDSHVEGASGASIEEPRQDLPRDPARIACAVGAIRYSGNACQIFSPWPGGSFVIEEVWPHLGAFSNALVAGKRYQGGYPVFGLFWEKL